MSKSEVRPRWTELLELEELLGQLMVSAVELPPGLEGGTAYFGWSLPRPNNSDEVGRGRPIQHNAEDSLSSKGAEKKPAGVTP
jgi:hypothetical protein